MYDLKFGELLSFFGIFFHNDIVVRIWSCFYMQNFKFKLSDFEDKENKLASQLIQQYSNTNVRCFSFSSSDFYIGVPVITISI